jgi:hypothetical protein
VLDKETIAQHEKDGDMGRGWLASNAAGSGPFTLNRWNPNDIVVLNRFDGYWGGEPKMKRVLVRHLSFMETFPEEGDMDMWRSLRTYAEVGYQYMIMPDHVPQVAGRDPQNTALAFTYGYIAALLQALNSETQ